MKTMRRLTALFAALLLLAATTVGAAAETGEIPSKSFKLEDVQQRPEEERTDPSAQSGNGLAFGGQPSQSAPAEGDGQTPGGAEPTPGADTLTPGAGEQTPEPQAQGGYLRDEKGVLVLDGNGNPIPLLAEGETPPAAYERTPDGLLILDANGNPIPKAETPDEGEQVPDEGNETPGEGGEAPVDPDAQGTPEPETQQPSAPLVYARDEAGELMLDEDGNPIPLLAEGETAPAAYERDADGSLMLDENGNPIPKAETPDEAEAAPAPDGEALPGETDDPAEAEDGTAMTVSGAVDVRLTANGMSEIVATVPAGGTLTVLSVEEGWAYVRYGEIEGYVFLGDLPEAEDGRPTPEPGETEAPAVKVTLFTSRRSTMAPGETVTLTSRIENLEYYSEYKMQWQVDKGNGFEDVPGATGDSYAFEASVETLAYDWQLKVYYR